MQINSEILALYKLIDDPDEEVYQIVSKRLVHFGKNILLGLEDLWENTQEDYAQKRIKDIIHQVNFKSLIEEFKKWNNHSKHDLIEGSNLIARFFYPNLQLETTTSSVKKINKSIWLELNDLLTSLEKVQIISKILFYFHEIKSERNDYNHLNNFFLHNLLEKRKGNAISTCILYQHLCESMHIPVQMINIPDQNVLACFQRDYKHEISRTPYKNLVLFYIDATNGKAFSQADLDLYYKQYGIEASAEFYQPLTHQQIIQKLLKEVGNCFVSEQQLHRKKELDLLASMIA